MSVCTAKNITASNKYELFDQAPTYTHVSWIQGLLLKMDNKLPYERSNQRYLITLRQKDNAPTHDTAIWYQYNLYTAHFFLTPLVYSYQTENEHANYTTQLLWVELQSTWLV